jgi:hypothetical protein
MPSPLKKEKNPQLFHINDRKWMQLCVVYCHTN